MWFVYALYNAEENKIYIGQTASVEKRLVEHNTKRGKHYTAKSKGVWVLIYKESAQTRKEAIVREKQLKSYKGRQFIKQNIPL